MPTFQAKAPLEFIPPNLNPLVLNAGRLVLPWWIKLQTNITQIDVKGTETLVKLYQDFAQEKVRFLMAFRHPDSDDPLCLAYMMWKIITKELRKQSKEGPNFAHAHFIFDRGIPLWAGEWTGSLYANLGGSSIQRGKLDWEGLRSARELFLNGKFPMAASPEGATNGHSQIVSPLEPGIAQLGFWCVEDIEKAERPEEVLILPLGIQYYYEDSPWGEISSLLSKLEQDCGLKSTEVSNPTSESLYPRLYKLGEYLLELMENFYKKYYHQKIEQKGDTLPERLPQLLDTALKVAETYFSITPKGNFSDRCRRLEQAGWDYIYREDFKNPKSLPPIEQGLGNLIAEEANLRMWHMRIAETFVAATGSYVKENPSVERFAETTLLLSDLVAKLKGVNPFPRPKLGKQRVEITIGTPISVSDRISDYRTSRRRAILNLTQDLQQDLTKLINLV